MKVIHFHNGHGGGVLSVIKNLFKYSQNSTIENHVIYTINVSQIKHFQAPQLENAATEKVFYYSPNWNFYYTCRQLAKLIPDQQAVLVAHDWLELGMISNLGLQNPVVQFVHGDYDYYYDLSIKHERWVDVYICVSGLIKEKLIEKLPLRKDNIYFVRLPVPAIKYKPVPHSNHQIVFVGRCEAAKGYFLLPKIEKALSEIGFGVNWLIIGEGSTDERNRSIWASAKNVKFVGKINQEELYSVLQEADFIVLPSVAEGTPVAVIEAMKAGVIPIVNDLPGGMRETISNGVNGFLVKDNAAGIYADVIIQLMKDKDLKKNISKNAVTYSNNFFDPQKNTAIIEGLLLSTTPSGGKSKQKIYGSRLDNPHIPNVITNVIRTVFN